MKKNYFFLIITILSFTFCKNATSQIVGGNVFLQGQWLEVGVDNMAAFGTCSSPATYHAHACCGTTPCATSGAAMDASYDWGHDGWGTGAPCFMGPYTQPGYPQEGWGIQVGATEYRNWAGGGLCTGSFTIPGSITGYTNTGGSAIGTFTGTVAGLNIIQDTRVDTFASWVVVTTRIYNTTIAPITGVYYERTCDPDNASDWGGGSTTENVILHQNEDWRHYVEIGTYSNSGIFNMTNSWMALGTKDCRAKCGVIAGLAPSNTPAQLWAGTGPVLTTYPDSNFADEGIFLVFNIGTILGNDSAVISYAYIYDGREGFDSALPQPALNVDGVVAYADTAFPGNLYDTFNVCAIPGTTSIPADVLYGADKTWTWSSWTWSPATGLASTTGVVNTINTIILPSVFTYTITGVDSATCETRTMYLTLLTCNTVECNSPCEGDSLKFRYIADSVGATFYWYKPGSGFTSTQQDPSIWPATYADSGEYYVIRTLGGVHDTDSTHVIIQYKPVITASNNSPLCQGMVDTLLLYASPDTIGETWSWTGPAGFTSTLENPTRPGYISIDTGIYRVITKTSFGCKDTAYTDAGIIPQPLPPIVSGPVWYCQNQPFVDWTVTGLVSGGRILWYPDNIVPIGDTLATPPSVNTTLAGVTTVYFSQRSGNCESKRDSFKVRVITTPSAPTASGNMEYCQFIGPVLALTVTPTADTVNWYFAATGGSPFFTEPLPVISVAGIYNYWISRTDSGCESPRNPVTITIHPKPNPPIITPTPICQLQTPVPLIATPDTTGVGLTLVAPTPLLWYGPGVTVATAVTPYPQTNVAPDTVTYYVTETTIYGCVSDSAIDVNVVKVKPPVPVTNPIAYCQYSPVSSLRALVDSIGDSHLNWYYNSTPSTSIPFTDTIPGIYTWYVSQTVPNNSTGCESDSSAVPVTIIYKPVFGINVSNTYVCEFDSLSLSYYGPNLFAPSYTWVLPEGAKAVSGTNVFDSTIIIEFDTANMSQYVYLTTTDDSGFCSTTDTVLINVVKQPYMADFSQPDVCLGDTVQLSLASASSGAYSFTWYIDKVLMANSAAINIISSNSNTGGPYEIKWVDTGLHVITVSSVSKEGCKSLTASDSVNVHGHPDPTFQAFARDSSMFCLQDSVRFKANSINYNYSYAWAPSNYFQNINAPVIWGTMDNAESIVTLTVTDPFGCYASASQTFYPQTCCTVVFPNAFTPNGTINKLFRPIMTGFHAFHEFRVVNRWGVTVFEGGNNDVSWDGNFNGVPQDMGTYFYYLKYDCGGKTIEAKGDVTLIR